MSAIYSFDALMQETLPPHAAPTPDASKKYANSIKCQHSVWQQRPPQQRHKVRTYVNTRYLNDETRKWLALAFYWTAYQFTVVSIY